MVTTLPFTVAACSRHERTALPSSSTVHAPHWPTPQPYFVPVIPRRLRRTESSGSSSAASTLCSLPLISRVMVGMMSPGPRAESLRIECNQPQAPAVLILTLCCEPLHGLLAGVWAVGAQKERTSGDSDAALQVLGKS